MSDTALKTVAAGGAAFLMWILWEMSDSFPEEYQPMILAAGAVTIFIILSSTSSTPTEPRR